MRSVARRALRVASRPVLPAVRIVVPFAVATRLLRFWLSALSTDPDPRRRMRRTLEVNDLAYRAADRAAIAYDRGVHVKHRMTRYHDFFVDRVRPGERVLDVGCGKGELAFDLAERAGATVVGIDFDPAHLAFARARSQHPRVTYIAGDVLAELPEERFDVVVLSNVLEHVEDRTGLLRSLADRTGARAFLIRVPASDRHWMVPLRQELGLPHFSDVGHFTEYTVPSFRAELAEAGLGIDELVQAWGEIWAASTPSPHAG